MAANLVSNEYRIAVGQADQIIKDTHRRLQGLRKEGRTPQWTRAAMQDAGATATTLLNAAMHTMQVEALEALAGSQKAYDRAVRGVHLGGITDKDASLAQLMQSRVAALFAGATPEQAMQRYQDFQLVDDHEKKNRYLLDEGLANVLRDTEYQHKLEPLVDSRRSPEEKAALAEVEVTDFFRAQGDPTMRAMLQSSMEQVLEGREPSSVGPRGYHGLLEELERNARQPYDSTRSSSEQAVV